MGAVEQKSLWTDYPYVFRPTSSGVNIYDMDTESVIAEASISLGVSSAWSNDTHLFMGTATSGILWMTLASISGSYDLTNQLYIYKGYPNITDNRVTYLHGSGDYLCAVTDVGVDHINLTTNSGIYTTVSGINKCHQTAEGRFYYIDDNLHVMYDNTSDWSSPDYTYPSGGIIPEDITINDISIAEGTPNTILIATSSGVVVIEEKENDEENSRFRYFFRESL